MAKGFHQESTIVLDCHHILHIVVPPEVGEWHYCRYCQTDRRVDDAPPVYRAMCQTGKCTFNRSTRADKDKALVQARTHVGKMTRHKVVVTNGRRTIATITNTDDVLFVTAEERKVIADDAQKLLKSLGLGGTAPA